jgi:hypothetical protein
MVQTGVLTALVTAAVWAAALPAAGAGVPAGADVEMDLVLRNALFQTGEAQVEGGPSLVVEVCREGGFWRRPWAVAEAFNNACHTGRVDEAAVSDTAIAVTIGLNIVGDAYVKGGRAVYSAGLRHRDDGTFEGTCTGLFRRIAVQGRALARIRPARTLRRTDRSPAVPGEHPRVLFRKADLPALREKAQTPLGRAALARLAGAAGPALLRTPGG